MALLKILEERPVDKVHLTDAEKRFIDKIMDDYLIGLNLFDQMLIDGENKLKEILAFLLAEGDVGGTALGLDPPLGFVEGLV